MDVGTNRDIEKYTKDYMKTTDLWAKFERSYQVEYRRNAILKSINNYSHKNILEIGCGERSLLNYVFDCDSFTVIEPSEVFCEKCKADISALNNAGTKYSVVQGFFGTDMPDKFSHKYDLIIISCLLHEVKDPFDMVSAALELLQDDGVIHINVPNSNSLHRLVAKKAGLIKETTDFSDANIKMQQNRVYCMKSLKNDICHAASMVDKNIVFDSEGGIMIKPFTHAQMEALIESGIINNEVMIGFEKLAEDLPDIASEIYVNVKLK